MHIKIAGGVDAGMACIAVAAGGKVSVDYEPYMPVYIKNQYTWVDLPSE